MSKKVFKKLKYCTVFLSAFLFTGVAPSFALEVINAKEIPVAEIAGVKGNKMRNANLLQPNETSFLGDTFMRNMPDKNKPEFHIKSIGEIITERREKKAKAKEEALKEQPKTEDIQIFCKEMEYFEDTNELEAREDVVIITKDGTKATAEKAIYNKDANTIKLINNVVLTKEAATIEGDYMFIDLNEENALMDEPKTTVGTLVVNAKEGYAFPDRIETVNGDVQFKDKVEMELVTRGFTRYNRVIPDKRLVDFSLKTKRSKPYTFKTKQVIVKPDDNYNTLTLDDVSVLYNDKTILKAPYIDFFQDKEQTVSEADFPFEFSSLKGFGMYAGLGHTFKFPQARTLRLTPAYVYGDHKSGVGLIGKLNTKKANIHAGWATSSNDLIVDGNINFTDNLQLSLGRHAYKSEWINGGNRAGYLAELAYDDSYYVKELDGAIFRHRITAGYVADYKREHQEDHMHDGYRYRYQAQLAKDFKTISSTEQDMYLGLGAVMQGLATAYSQGDTVAFFRFGPSITTRVKRWNSNITYTMGGVHGNSPYRFDEYRYGRQTVNFDESIILNRFVSVGYRGTLTLLKDNSKGEILTENRFYAVAGPEDFKIAFSYDTIRQNMQFDFLFLLGSENLNLKYDKLIVKDPNKMGKPAKKPSDKNLYKVRVPESL